MKIIYISLFLFVCLLLQSTVSSATSYTWNIPGSTGAWTTTTNWTPTAPAGGPTTGDDIIINPTAAITINTVPTVTLNSITVGGTASANTLTLTGVTTAKVVTVTTSATVTGGGLIAGSLLSFSFPNGSIYNHQRDGGTIPTATWGATSTCNITGITVTNVTTGAQTFGYFTWNNTGQTTATGTISSAITVASDLTVTAGTLNFNGFVVTAKGAVTNNGTINTTTTSSALTLSGTTAQVVSGSGTWTTGTAGRLLNLTVNNTSGGSPAVDLQTNLAIQTTLNLTAGAIGSTTSNTLTLGIGSSATLTTNVVAGTLPVAMTAYNLAGMTYNLYYGNGATSYTTGGELPSGSLTNAQSPVAGTMYMSNGASTYSTVVLGNNGTIAGLQIYNNANSILRLNGDTLQFSGGSGNTNSIANAAQTATSMGLDASVAGSALSFISAGIQYINFGNQTFSSVLTKPNVIVSNTNAATGADVQYQYQCCGGGTWSVNDLNVLSGGYFQVGSSTTDVLNVYGNLTNNGTIMCYGNGYNNVINMIGASQQTISGSGVWKQLTANPGSGVFSGLSINNSNGVVLNQSFAVTTSLYLTKGTLSGSGVLTLGNAVSGTLNIYVAGDAIGGGASGTGAILPTSMAAYSLANMTFNAYYGNGSTAYTTAGELPPATLTNAQSPVTGTMYMANSTPNVYSTVVLGRSGTVSAFYIYNQTNSILRLNGDTLQLSGGSGNTNTSSNLAQVATTTGLDASVTGSALKFISAGIQYINFGNQTFSSVLTKPNVIVSNTNAATGADVQYQYQCCGGGTWSVNDLNVLSGGYFQVGSSTTDVLNVYGNLTNNGTIMCYGNGYNNVINMIGASQQTISGSGVWKQLTANPGSGVFSGLSINNSNGVVLNQSFAVSTSLYLTSGTLSGSGTLTLGNGASGQTLNLYVAADAIGGGTSGAGAILPTSMAAYSLANMTFNAYYGNGATAYTTAGELPPATLTNAQSPVTGTMYMANSTPNVYSTVALGRSGTVSAFYIYNQPNSILRLNGDTLQFSGGSGNTNTISNLAQSAAGTMGLDASVSGSALKFISAGIQYINFGNQTFSSVLTKPDVIVSNTNAATGADVQYQYQCCGGGTWSVNDLNVLSGGYFQVGSSTTDVLNVYGNLTNNGTIMCYGNGYNNVINMIGASQQTISGSGVWKQLTANPGSGVFSGLSINNSNGVVLNQSFAVTTSLYLTKGTLSGSGILTLGNGASGQTLNLYVAADAIGGGSSGTGAILPTSMAAYNLANMTFNAYYGNGSTAYTTAGELPPATLTNAQSPVSGTMYMASSTASPYSTVILGRSSTVAAFYIYNNTNSILRLNGDTLQLSGGSGNTNTIQNLAQTANTTGLDASVSGSALKFISAGIEYINFGNQTFSSVLTKPNVIVSNTNAATGADVQYQYQCCGGGTWSVNDLNVLSGGYFQVGSSTTDVLNVYGNLTNNGTIMCYGNGYNNVINMIGASQQTIAGSGVWKQLTQNPGTGVFSGLSINNSNGVVLNQSFAVSTSLYLTSGILSGSGILTLGNGASGQTLNLYVAADAIGGGSSGTGGILPTSMAAYNLANMTFNAYYGNGSTAYTTAGELPPATLTNAQSPISGTMYMASSTASPYSTVILGRSSTVAAFYIYNNTNSILRLNGDTLQLSGGSGNTNTIQNLAQTANTTGLDASVSGSALKFISAGIEYINFGNQTFSSVLTKPNVIVSNTNTATGADVQYQYQCCGGGTWSVNDLNVLSGGYFQVGSSTTDVLNVYGNLTNNGTIMCYGNGYNNVINMIGASQQTIAGSGVWKQLTQNPGTGVFSGLSINNSNGVVLNQSFAVTTSLYLTKGTLSGSGVLTLGNGASGQTLNLYVAADAIGGGSSGTGGILPVTMAAYNVANMTFNAYYGNGSTSYTTAGELPPATLTNAQSPISGTMYMASSTASPYSTVILGRSSTVAAFYIYNNTNSILRLNGDTLQLSGGSGNTNTIQNLAQTANTTGLDASVSGSALKFISAGIEYINFGNQTFSSVLTKPNVIVSNTNTATGADVQYQYQCCGGGTWSVNDLNVLSGGYFQVGSSTTDVLNVYGNLTNNGTIMCYGNGYNNVINMIGASQQTIAGSGVWKQLTQNPGTGVFSGLSINNSNGVVLNQSFAVTTSLYLTKGTLSGSGVLTLGNGASGQTLNLYVAADAIGGGSSGTGGILPVTMAAYNVANMTFNAYYGNGSTSYTTAGELPPATLTNAQSPISGTMYMASSTASPYSTVILGRSSTVAAFYIYNNTNSILRLNGDTLQLSGGSGNTNTIQNLAQTANTTGLDASVSGSALKFISAGIEYINFGNQTFSSVLTKPNVIVSNTNTATGADVQYQYQCCGGGTWSVNDLNVLSGGYFQVGSSTTDVLNVYGNLTNNGTIMCYGNGYNNVINMIGASQQTIAGSGVWKQLTANPGSGVFSGLSINNSNGVVLNQSFAVTTSLYLTKGTLSGSGILTLGNGASGQTLNLYVAADAIGGGSSGTGAILPTSMAAYNLANMTFNAYYGNGSTAYTTAGELPPATLTNAQSPVSGTMYMASSTASPYSTVILGRSSTVAAFYIYNNTNSILRLNGDTLQLSGGSGNTNTIQNLAQTANTTGLDASVSGSALKFISAGIEYINFGNQTFSSVLTKPNVIVSNTNAATGADVQYQYQCCGGGTWSVNDLNVLSGGYFQVGSSTTDVLNVYGNLTNNGTIMCYGNGYNNVINMIGASQQTIAGSGVWKQLSQNPGTGVFSGLQISNTSGASPGVIVNMSLGITTSLTLTSGSIKTTNSNTLTLGNGVANTITVVVTNGTDSMTTAFNYTSMTSNYTYNGTSAQTTTNELASSISSLTINNSSGVNLNTSTTVSASTGLTLTSGRLYLGSNNLTYATTATSTGGTLNASNMVVADGTGQLMKSFPATSASFTFPIGDNSGSGAANNSGPDYSPVTLNFSANSAIRTIGVRVTDAIHPNGLPSGNYITRYWSFTDGLGTGTYAYTGTFTYSTTAPSDLVGTYGSATIERWNGTSWTPLTTTYPGAPSFNTSSATQTTGTLGGNDFTAQSNSTTYHWIGSGSTPWTTSGNWSPTRSSALATDILLFDQGQTSTATSIPTETDAQILVSNNTNITFNSASSLSLSVNGGTGANNISVASGSTLTLGTTVNLRYLAAGASGQLGNIAGTLNVNASGTFTTSDISSTVVTVAGTGIVNQNGGAITSSAATLAFSNNSTYNHSMVGGTIATATWNAGSNCVVKGATTAAPAGLGQSFSNFNWNCNGETTTIPLGAALTTVNGTLTITNTGATPQILSLASTTLNLTVGGDLVQTGGIVSMNITGSAVTTLNLGGSFNQSGGTWQNGSSTGIQVINFTGVGKTYAQTGTLTNTNINYNVNSPASLTLNNNLAIQASRTLTIASGASLTLNTGTLSVATGGSITNNGTLTCGSNIITGAGSFSNTSATTTTLSLGDAGGISASGSTGNVEVSASRTYGVSANYIYAGSSSGMVTGSGLVAANNLTISNANGVSQTGTNVTVSNLLTLTSGQFAIGGSSGAPDTLVLNGPAIGGSPANLSSTVYSTLVFGGSSSGISIPSSIANLNSLKINNTNGVSMGSSITINGVLTLASGNLSIGSNVLTLAGTVSTTSGFLAGSNSSELDINGTGSSGTINFASGAQSLLNLTMNRTSSGTMTLGSNLSIGTASTGTLTLSNGIINTGSNVITILNANLSGISGGSSASYTNGLLARTLLQNYSAGGIYNFPIGGSAYQLLSLIGPVTANSSSLVVVQAQEVDSNASGSAGAGIASLNTNRYWQASVVANSGNLTDAGQIALYETTPAMTNGTTEITNSSTLTGTYNLLASAVAGNIITTITSAPLSLGYFVIGTGEAATFTYNVKLFLQGYYLPGGSLSPLLKLTGNSINATDVDTVTIELHNSSSPYNLAYSSQGILQTSNTVSCSFDGGASGNNYYIVVKHRNSLETWSADSVSISSNGTYDFTTSANQAYGSNMTKLGNGSYAIYSGDVNQDGTIDASDRSQVQTATAAFTQGSINSNDVNGDGLVDEGDLRIIKNNIGHSISVQHP